MVPELGPAPQELRDNSASFRLLAEDVRDCAIYLLDPQGCVATWNSGAERLMQYTAEEIIGQHLSRFYLPDDIATDGSNAELARALAEGRTVQEGWRRRRDGSLFRAHVVITPIYDSAGKHLGYGQVTRDISRDLSQEHMRSVIDHVPDGVLSTDDKGNIQSFNLAAEGIFGCKEEEVIGQDVKLLLEPQGGEQDSFLQGDLRTGLAKSGGNGRQLTGRRNDGSTFPMELAINSFEQEGRIFFTGIVRDISARVDEEARMRAILDNVPDLVILIDNEGLVQSINRAAEEMSGYSAAEIVGMPFCHLTLETERPEIMALLDRMFQGNQSRAAGLERTCLRKDGTVFPIDLSLNEFMLSGKHYIIGVARDATERRDREARLRAILDNATDAIITVDQDGIVQSFNSAAERIYGYTETEMSGREVFVLAPEEQRTEFADLIRRMCSGEQPLILDMEGQGQRKDKTVFQLELSLNVFALGGKQFVIGLYRDITQRKRLENQLRQSQKMEAIGSLAGGIAHDFNNMLTVINGYSEIVLAKLPQESELQGFVGEILLAGERAALLTSQLLAFSRQLVLAPRVLNLNTVVAETERMLRRLIGEDITMSTALDPQLNRVKVDQGQIIQVIMNLAVNARDAMPQGGKLTIETRNVDVDAEHLRFLPDCVAGSYVLLSVTDTGSGMSKEVRSRIFEPFFTTKGPGKGTGLGLATVYGIVKQSGGGLDVYSEPGHGTTFRVYLPAVAGQNVAAQPASVEASAQRGTETILLAEDDNSVRKIIVAALGRLGYVVLAASRGSEALELARMREGGIQLLLTDLIMPEMNGRQLAEAILPLLPDVKVLYMSGYTDDTVVRHGLVANKVAFLQKPFTPTSLAQKVREVLDQD